MFSPDDLKLWETVDHSRFSDPELAVIRDIVRRRKKDIGGMASRYARIENLIQIELSNRTTEKVAVVKKAHVSLIEYVKDCISLADLPRLSKLPENFNSWKLVSREGREFTTDALPHILCGQAMVSFLIGMGIGKQVKASNPPKYHVDALSHWWTLTHEGNDYLKEDKLVELRSRSDYELCMENPSKVFVVRNRNIRI